LRLSRAALLRPLLAALAIAAAGFMVEGSSAQVAPAPPAATPPAAPPYRVDVPAQKTLYTYGPDGRYLLAGSWLFRFDLGRGSSAHFERSNSVAGWKTVSVPNAWNATDQSSASMRGTVAWYRKDFRLPSSDPGATWIVRFESVNYRSDVWLNGQPIGSHAGVFLPFEFELPGKLLKRGATNHLVIRVDNRRHLTDFPPASIGTNGAPSGGWWNYGGILREVYLRKVNRIDFQSVQVLPILPCPTCPASIRYRVALRNYAASTQSVNLSATFGTHAAVNLGSVALGAGAAHTFVRTVPIGHAQLWYPASPYLYDVNLNVRAGATHVAHYFLRSGVRSIQVSSDGLLLLNGQVLNMRGVGLQEDSKLYGFAIDNTIRARYIAETKALGATFIRSQYPLHPYIEELADANGIMLWSEIPVFSVHTPYLDQPGVLRQAHDDVQQNILANGSHASVIIWSIANELSPTPEPAQTRFINSTVAAAKGLDPTRPVGLAVASNPVNGCQAGPYSALDVIGLNDYFGWYQGQGAGIADRDLLSDYLDSMRLCYPHKALMVTEFGAEANRPGPVEERGTYAFQTDFLDFHLALFASKPWLAAATWWALEEFRVRPGWDGGDPRPQPPIHNKGLISFDGVPKPAYFEAQRVFSATPQLRPR
jgi:beta-glucuronidase